MANKAKVLIFYQLEEQLLKIALELREN